METLYSTRMYLLTMFIILCAINFLLLRFYLIVGLYQLLKRCGEPCCALYQSSRTRRNQNNATPSAALRHITFGTLTFHFISSAASRIDIAAKGIIPLSIIAP